MKVNVLPSDSTIKSVWPYLTHQDAYVRGLYQKMRECNKTHGNAHVRVGITGTGQKPYYRIFHLNSENGEEIFGSFYDNHDPLESAFAKTNSWSTQSMEFDEVENFFADTRGFKGKRPK